MARQTKKGGKPTSARSPDPSLKIKPTDDAFVQSIHFVLEHYNEYELIGQQSPLSAPYFLGLLLNAAETHTPAARGKTLSKLVEESALTTTFGELLRLYYLDARIRKMRNRANAVAEALFIGRAEVMRRRKLGVIETAKHLSQRVLPPLRTEHPQRRVFVGREAVIAQSLVALKMLQPVALAGNSGMGKTTTGLAIATNWGTTQVLWFTLRLDLNDRLTSLVFAIAYFLRNLGAQHTWRQVVADDGRLKDQELLLGLIRRD